MSSAGISGDPCWNSQDCIGCDRWRGFFTTEVWTRRGLVTYYTVCVIDLALRRVQVIGSTPLMFQCAPTKSVVNNNL